MANVFIEVLRTTWYHLCDRLVSNVQSITILPILVNSKLFNYNCVIEFTNCLKNIMFSLSVSEVAAGDYGSEWINRMVNGINTEFPIIPISQQTNFEFQINATISKVSWLEQFIILSKRKLLQLRRNKVQKYSIIKKSKKGRFHERYLAKSFIFFRIIYI